MPPGCVFKSSSVTELCSVCSHPAQMVHSPLSRELGTGPQHEQGLHIGCIMQGTLQGMGVPDREPSMEVRGLALGTTYVSGKLRTSSCTSDPTSTPCPGPGSSHRAASRLLASEGSIHQDGKPKPSRVRGWQETCSMVRTSICRPKNRKQLQSVIVAARQPPAKQAAGRALPGTEIRHR